MDETNNALWFWPAFEHCAGGLRILRHPDVGDGSAGRFSTVEPKPWTGHNRDTGCRLISQTVEIIGAPEGIRTLVDQNQKRVSACAGRRHLLDQDRHRSHRRRGACTSATVTTVASSMKPASA